MTTGFVECPVCWWAAAEFAEAVLKLAFTCSKGLGSVFADLQGTAKIGDIAFCAVALVPRLQAISTALSCPKLPGRQAAGMQIIPNR